jgi:phage gp36-like protein
MSNPLAVTLHGLAAETTSGASAALDLGTVRNALRLVLDVEAITAAASLTVAIQTSPTGTGGWVAVAAFDAVTATTSVEQSFGSLQRFVRAAWTITGATPSISFGLAGVAHVTYAKVRDLTTLGIATKALQTVSVHDKVESLLAASAIADRYLCRQFTLPLASWGDDLRRMVAQIAVYDLMAVRGFQPQGVDELIVKRYDDAIAALREMAAGKACMPDVVDTTPETSSEGEYDVAETQPDIFFSEYPFNVDITRTS